MKIGCIIGFVWLHLKDCWGKNYGTEAISLIVAYAGDYRECVNLSLLRWEWGENRA